MNKNNLVSQSEFARIIGISKQAIFSAIKKNQLTIIIDGKKKRINLNGKKTKLYMLASSPQRNDDLQKYVKTKSKLQPIIKGKKPTGKKKVITKVKKKQGKNELIIKPSESGNKTIDTGNEDDESFEYTITYLKARAEKEKETVIQKKLQNAKIRGDLLSREIVYTSIMMYLDKLHSNLERLSGSYLSDIGSDIVTAGNVTPAIRNRWRSGVMEQIDDAKKIIVKKIKEIEKGQAG